MPPREFGRLASRFQSCGMDEQEQRAADVDGLLHPWRSSRLARRRHTARSRVKQPRSGRLATADADPPSLSHGHLVGDSTGPGRRALRVSRRPGADAPAEVRSRSRSDDQIMAERLTIYSDPSKNRLRPSRVQGSVIPDYVDQMIFSAARIRNAAGAHETGATPRYTPEELAIACVAAAGVALSYLGTRLP